MALLKIKLNEKGLQESKELKEKEKIEKFHLLPKYKQGSKEWHYQRYNYLTASTIATALGLKGKSARQELLLSKASFGKTNTFIGNYATLHGNKMEPVANAIYSKKNGNVVIHEFGMITNDKYPILGVSPDGILTDRMLEIKCPYSRVIDGKIKLEYYHQMQEQMVVCDYTKCDFLECKFDMITEIDFWSNFIYFKNEKGVIMSYIDDEDPLNASIKYLYSNLDISLGETKSWIEEMLSTKIILYIYFWKLSFYNCQEVLRDDNWIVKNYPILTQFWNEVLELREKGIEENLESLDIGSTETEVEVETEKEKPAPRVKLGCLV